MPIRQPVWCSKLIVAALFGWLVLSPAQADTLTLNLTPAYADNLSLSPAWNGEIAIETENNLALPTLDSLAIQYRNQLDVAETGFSLKRYSARLQLGEDILSVGRDWSGFQDLLDLPVGLENTTADAPTTNQVRFQRQGLALALEQPTDSEISTAPQLVISWRGQTEQSQLGIAVLGQPAGEAAESDFGWGINLKGGLRFGKLFTALGVSMGEQIDALLPGNPDQPKATGPTLLVTPQLHYEVGDNSNAWLGLSRYATRDTGLTLDTIHLGYQWQVLPGTQLDIEFAGDLSSEETTGQTLTIGAQHRF